MISHTGKKNKKKWSVRWGRWGLSCAVSVVGALGAQRVGAMLEESQWDEADTERTDTLWSSVRSQIRTRLVPRDIVRRWRNLAHFKTAEDINWQRKGFLECLTFRFTPFTFDGYRRRRRMAACQCGDMGWGGEGKPGGWGWGGVVEPGDGLVNKCQFRRELWFMWV